MRNVFEARDRVDLEIEAALACGELLNTDALQEICLNAAGYATAQRLAVNRGKYTRKQFSEEATRLASRLYEEVSPLAEHFK